MKGAGTRRADGTPRRKAPRSIRLAALAVAGLMIAASQVQGQQIESGLLDKKNQIKQLEFEKAQVQRRLRSFDVTESETLEEIEALSEQLREVKWREGHLTTRRNAQRRKSRRQAARIRALTSQIEKNRARVGRHVKGSPMQGAVRSSLLVFVLAVFATTVLALDYRRQRLAQAALDVGQPLGQLARRDIRSAQVELRDATALISGQSDR